MTSELEPIDIIQVPELAALVEEVLATGKGRRIARGDLDVAVLPPATPRRRRLAPNRLPLQDEGDPVIAELERRRRQGMNVADMTAGILKPCAKTPPPTPREEKEAFEQAVADQVMESSRE